MVGAAPPMILPPTITYTIKDWDGHGGETEYVATLIDQRQWEVKGDGGEEAPIEDTDYIQIGVYQLEVVYQGSDVQVGICTNSMNPMAQAGALAVVDALTRTILAVPSGGVVENTVSPITLEMMLSEVGYQYLARERIVGGMGVFNPYLCDMDDINWFWPRQYESTTYVPPKRGNWENGGGPPFQKKKPVPPH